MNKALCCGGRLGFPFLPFTFPSVGFSSAASKLGYNIGWLEGGDIYGIYKAGVTSGAIKKPGNTTDAMKYLMSQGIDKNQALAWLDTADQGVKAGTWNTTLLYPTGGFVTDLLKAAGEEVGGAVHSAGEGIAGAAGLNLSSFKTPAKLIGAGVLIIAGVYAYSKISKA